MASQGKSLAATSPPQGTQHVCDGLLLVVNEISGVAEIWLARPARGNAMHAPVWEHLPRVLDNVLQNNPNVRCVLIAGEGNHFCTGIDVEHLQTLGKKGAPRSDVDGARQREALRRDIMKMQDAFTAFERLRCPVVAAIHGACVGGAIDLVTAVDIRLCTKDARFCVKEVDVGLAADVGTLQRLPYIVGHGVAAELCLTAREFDGNEAVRHGLCSRAFDDSESLLTHARALCASLAAKSPIAVSGTKRVLLRVRDSGSVADNLEFVATWNSAQLITEDVAETFHASRAKRPPHFKNLLAKL